MPVLVAPRPQGVERYGGGGGGGAADTCIPRMIAVQQLDDFLESHVSFTVGKYAVSMAGSLFRGSEVG